MNVALVDYGMGNLGSVRRSFEECGAQVSVTHDPKDIEKASHLVLPGVGAFADGMENLRRLGFGDAIRKAVLEGHTPLLGICLGMQLLADSGDEGGPTVGLQLIPGEVKLFEPGPTPARIPHIGWNEVWFSQSSRLFEGIPSGSDFYFVHSYRFLTANSDEVLATTPYCGSFVSAVGRGSVWGVQFHPEKSSKRGFDLIRNFLRLQKRESPC